MKWLISMRQAGYPLRSPEQFGSFKCLQSDCQGFGPQSIENVSFVRRF